MSSGVALHFKEENLILRLSLLFAIHTALDFDGASRWRVVTIVQGSVLEMAAILCSFSLACPVVRHADPNALHTLTHDVYTISIIHHAREKVQLAICCDQWSDSVSN